MKHSASPGSMHETGCSGPVHWDDSEGWDGEGRSGWGTHVHPWLIHVNECTCVLHPKPPSHISPHSIPQGHPSTPALNTLSHASNLDWQSISHMVIYMFQCYLSNYPILGFSHRVQKSVLYICFSFAVSHIGSSLPSF